MSIIQGTAKGGSASFYDFPIEQSLRFDGSSYLSGLTTTNTAQKFTISTWLKFSAVGIEQQIFQTRTTSNGSFTNNYRFFISLVPTTDVLRIRNYDGSGSLNYSLDTTSVFRDTSAFYHFVFVFDTTASANNRVKIYVNGNVLILNPATDNLTTPIRISSLYTYIGRTPGGTGYLNGYLANIQFIDGQALDQYFFGEFKDNIWVPYNAFSTAGSGTATASDGDTATDSYGTNGFHLDFADSSNIGNDVSGNNNDWTVN